MKKLLMFMSIFMIGSQIRPMLEGSHTALIGTGAYIGTSVLIKTTINAVKPGTERTPFTQANFVPSICAALTGIMAYEGEYKKSCCLGIATIATALLVTAYKVNQTDSNNDVNCPKLNQ